MAKANKAPYLATTGVYLCICVVLLLIGLVPFWGFPFLIMGGIGIVATPFVALFMMQVVCPYCGMEETVMPKNDAYSCGRCQKRVLIEKHGSDYETRES